MVLRSAANELTNEPGRTENRDRVLPFTVDALDLRGRVVTLGPAIDAILKRHAYPDAVSVLLGQAVTLTALLGSALKFDGRFTLQTKTDGAVPMLVVDFQSPDQIRAYASFDEAEVTAILAKPGAAASDLLGHGHLALTIDQGAHMSRYQGIVVLDGIDLEEVAHNYFAQSEQIPTRVRLAVGQLTEPDPAGGSRTTWRAGGLLAQFLPEDGSRIVVKDISGGDDPSGGAAAQPALQEDEAWNEGRTLVDTIEDHELFDPEISAERLLFRLFNQHEIRVFEAGDVKDQCRCSRERIAKILDQFGDDERSTMIEDGQIVVRCEFCSTEYRFDPSEV